MKVVCKQCFSKVHNSNIKTLLCLAPGHLEGQVLYFGTWCRCLPTQMFQSKTELCLMVSCEHVMNTGLQIAIIFLTHLLIIWSLKCQIIVENAHHIVPGQIWPAAHNPKALSLLFHKTMKTSKFENLEPVKCWHFCVAHRMA